MDFALEPDVDPAISEAVRASAARAGAIIGSLSHTAPGAWWLAGVAEATETSARPSTPAEADDVAAPYEAARSPRRTRGATRA